MKKSGKIFIWVLVIVIILLILYVIFGGKKAAPAKVNILNPVNNNPALPVVVSPPVLTSGEQTFSINDQIYAGSNLTNVYTSCAPSSTNIYQTYNQGDLIGTYLRKEGLCIVLAVKTYPGGFSWIPIEGSDEVYLPFNSLIYKA